MTTDQLRRNRDNHHPLKTGLALSRRWRKWQHDLVKAAPNVGPKAERLNSACHLPFNPALSRAERSDLRAQWRREMAAA